MRLQIIIIFISEFINFCIIRIIQNYFFDVLDEELRITKIKVPIIIISYLSIIVFENSTTTIQYKNTKTHRWK